MKVLVDADGCPVVGLTITLAGRRKTPVLLICDSAHEMQREGAETLVVTKGADSADFALVNRIAKGDVVVTQDYGLAAMALAKGAYVLNQNGLRYTDANIDGLLMARHTARKIRMGGGRLRGPSKRTEEQDNDFAAAFAAILELGHLS